jgi:ABC-type polysaccharide transport system permease subunit
MARSKTVTVAPARKPKKQYKLLFMVLPFMVLVLLFNYVPIFGWICRSWSVTLWGWITSR